jgi:septum formation protein
MELSDEEIGGYIDSGEPMDKAGAYAIQGGAGKFIENIDGDYYAIMGLPINILYKHLKDIEEY